MAAKNGSKPSRKGRAGKSTGKVIIPAKAVEALPMTSIRVPEAIAAGVVDLVNEMRKPDTPKPKPRPKTLRLSEEACNRAARDLDRLGMMFGAIERLSFLIDDTDHTGETHLAGAVALEAICKLGAWRADALGHELGINDGCGVGLFREELERLACIHRGQQ